MEYSELLELYITDNAIDIISTKEIADRICELLRTKDIQIQKIVNMSIDGMIYHEISEKSFCENIGI